MHLRERGLVVKAVVDRGSVEGITMAQVEVTSTLAHLPFLFRRNSKLVGLALCRVRRDVRRAEMVSLFCLQGLSHGPVHRHVHGLEHLGRVVGVQGFHPKITSRVEFWHILGRVVQFCVLRCSDRDKIRVEYRSLVLDSP